MSAPTGVDASAVELAEHAKLHTTECKARRHRDEQLTAVDELERDLRQAKLDLETADEKLEAAEMAREGWLVLYWAKRGGEPGRKPWENAPKCPSCEAPCGTEEGEVIELGDLRCAACGEDWTASEAELEQARAADAAWAAECKRASEVAS